MADNHQVIIITVEKQIINMNEPNTIKVFYHPLSVVANIEKAAGSPI
ncbi:MAG: hypothetical protein HZA06_03405 [Nitrospirae bacterium]|nr:hypothetical protein [Nitrospirota bacterium]